MKKLLVLISVICSLNANTELDNTQHFFGGNSQNKVVLPKSTIHTAPLVVTEEVFTAKDSKDIDRAIENQQLKDIASGKTAKEFLEDRTGHLYGGLSEVQIILNSKK